MSDGNQWINTPGLLLTQLLTVVTCSLLHHELPPLPFLSHIPMVVSMLPGITSQINSLYSNPCPRFHFGGNST